MYLGGTEFGNLFGSKIGLKNAPLRKGFVGCVSSLQMDGKSINLQVKTKKFRVIMNLLIRDCETTITFVT